MNSKRKTGVLLGVFLVLLVLTGACGDGTTTYEKDGVQWTAEYHDYSEGYVMVDQLTVTVEDLSWGDRDDTIIKYLYDTTIEIPAYLDGNSVVGADLKTAVLKMKFDSYYYGEDEEDYPLNVFKIALAEGIKKIADHGFEGSYVQYIKFPSTLEEIGDYAFNRADLRYYDGKLPENLKEIGKYAFAGSKITRIEIPTGITKLNAGTFSGCASLQSVVLPESMEQLGNFVLDSCTVLGEIYLPSSITSMEQETFGSYWSRNEDLILLCPNNSYTLQFAIENDMNYVVCYGADDIGDHVIREGDWLFMIEETGAKAVTYLGTDTELKIPSICNKVPVTSIGNPFAGKREKSQISKIEIPDTVTSIDASAFEDCSELKDVNFPSELRTIGNFAFRNTQVTEIKLPESLASIGQYAFSSCPTLKSVTISSPNLNLGSNCFSTCPALSSVVLPEGLEAIPDQCFSDCQKLSSVNIPTSVKSIGQKAFSNCALTQIVLPEDLTELGEECFQLNLYLISVQLPRKLKTLSTGLFSYCSSLSQVVLLEDNELETISAYAFQNNSALSEIYIPKSVKFISSNAFRSTYQVEILCQANTVALNFAIQKKMSYTIVSEDYAPGIYRLVTEGDWQFYISKEGIRVEAYLGTDHELTLPATCENNPIDLIHEDLFYQNTEITRVTIPGTIREIGSRVFSGCVNLTEVTINDGVVSIGEEAFYQCTGLTSLKIPASVGEIGARSFSGCSGLTEVTINDGVVSIGEEAFYQCTGLTSLKIPASVGEISARSFSSCAGLTEVEIGDGVTTIGAEAFNNCYNITKITIPNSVTSIDGNILSWSTIWRVNYGSYAAKYAASNGMPYVYLPYTPTAIKTNDMTVAYGKESALQISIEPADLDYKSFETPEFIFESEDESIVKISENGTVYGVSPGTTTVYVTDRLNSFINASATITVVDRRGKAGSLTIYGTMDRTGLTVTTEYIICGGVPPYEAVINPIGRDGYTQTLYKQGDAVTLVDTLHSFSNDVGSIIIVTDSAHTVVGANATGVFQNLLGDIVSEMYGVVSETGDEAVTANRMVRAYPAKEEINLARGEIETVQVYAQIAGNKLGIDQNNESFVFFSENEEIATADAFGNIYGIGAGETVVNVYDITGSGFHFSIPVHVIMAKASGLELTAGENIDGVQIIEKRITPTGASDLLQWSSSDPQIAEVDDGTVYWHKAGDVTITAATMDGSEIIRQLRLHFDGIPVESIQIKIDPDNDQHIIWDILPHSATEKDVTVQTDKPTILTITDQYYLWFKKEGTATVRVTALDGSNVYAEMEVSGSPNHAHVPSAGSAILAESGKEGISPEVVCLVCGETMLTEQRVKNAFWLPSSTKKIETEAFYNINIVEQIYIPDGVKTIPENTFANCKQLRMVYVPASVTTIAENAFENTTVIVCPAGSYAEKFAYKNKIPCSVQ